jgi:hypothetical protein
MFLNNLLFNLKFAEQIECSIFEFSLNYVNANDINYTYICNIYNDKLNEIYLNLD